MIELETADESIVHVILRVEADGKACVHFQCVAEVGNFLVGMLSCASRTPVRFEMACFVKKSIQFCVLLLLKRGGQVFSVSPMYFRITIDKVDAKYFRDQYISPAVWP